MSDTSEGFPPARAFVERQLPPGATSGHELLYGQRPLEVTPAQLDACLADYRRLLEVVLVPADGPLAALNRVMAFEMMEANELVLSYVTATDIRPSEESSRAIVAALDACLTLVNAQAPMFVGYDFCKRYASLRDRLAGAG
jgi:hypothetical protein